MLTSGNAKVFLEAISDCQAHIYQEGFYGPFS